MDLIVGSPNVHNIKFARISLQHGFIVGDVYNKMSLKIYSLLWLSRPDVARGTAAID